MSTQPTTATVTKTTMAIPARKRITNAGSTKYDLGSLVPGSTDCLIITDCINMKRAVSRLTSAVASYRKRPGNANAQFTVHTFDQDDGTQAVGVWRKLDKTDAEVAAEAVEVAAEATAEAVEAAQ